MKMKMRALRMALKKVLLLSHEGHPCWHQAASTLTWLAGLPFHIPGDEVIEFEAALD
jgi:hypothetical protein